MPDREKVIKGLECCLVFDEDWFYHCDECPYRATEDERKVIDWCCHLEELRRDALELLKNEYEFVKVKHHDISNADDTTFDDEFWCEGCGTVWQMVKEETNFCPHCGKAVKWDDACRG